MILRGRGGSSAPVKPPPSIFIVTAAAGSNGAITPASAIVATNQTTTFTVTPETEFVVASVSGCDGSLIGSTHTTGAVLAGCSVTVQYATYMRTVFDAAAYEFPYPVDSLGSGADCRSNYLRMCARAAILKTKTELSFKPNQNLPIVLAQLHRCVHL